MVFHGIHYTMVYTNIQYTMNTIKGGFTHSGPNFLKKFPTVEMLKNIFWYPHVFIFSV